MICPMRLLERSQVFTDCIHLLKQHEPGNELRVIPELAVPGGSVDYCLVSVRDGKPRDFVGIELQTLDTTGSVWLERQRFVHDRGVHIERRRAASTGLFGMNWKMSSKTILVQLNHKILTFESVFKRLVLVVQDCLISYMRKEFAFDHIKAQRDGDSMQIHAYDLRKTDAGFALVMKERWSTDAAGIARCLGLQVDATVELKTLLQQLEQKLPRSMLLTVGGQVPPPSHLKSSATDES